MQINDHLKSIDWNELKSLCSIQEFPELFHLTVLQTCMLYTPLKEGKEAKLNQYVKARNIIRRRKGKVRSQINAIKSKNPSAEKLRRLRAELYDLNQQLNHSIMSQQDQREYVAVDRIKKNPRYFYSFARANRKLVSNIEPLQNVHSSISQFVHMRVPTGTFIILSSCVQGCSPRVQSATQIVHTS